MIMMIKDKYNDWKIRNIESFEDDGMPTIYIYIYQSRIFRVNN